MRDDIKGDCTSKLLLSGEAVVLALTLARIGVGANRLLCPSTARLVDDKLLSLQAPMGMFPWRPLTKASHDWVGDQNAVSHP